MTDLLDPADVTDAGPFVAEIAQGLRLRMRRATRGVVDFVRAEAAARAELARSRTGRRLLQSAAWGPWWRIARAWRIAGSAADGGPPLTALCLAPDERAAGTLLDALFSGLARVHPRGRRRVDPRMRPEEDLVIACIPPWHADAFRGSGWRIEPAAPRHALRTSELAALAARLAPAPAGATEGRRSDTVERRGAAATWDLFCRTMYRPSQPGGLRERPPALERLRRLARGADIYLSARGGRPLAGWVVLREGDRLRLLASGVLHGSPALARGGALRTALTRALGDAARAGCTIVSDETGPAQHGHGFGWKTPGALLAVRAGTPRGRGALSALGSLAQAQGRQPELALERT